MSLARFLLRTFTCAGLALLASSALADGKAFTPPQKAKVEMADQQALIAFDGKQETLVIDTRIKPVDVAASASSGKQSYAWVVPLPAVPTRVEAGTTGMFDTLRELTRPELVSGRAASAWGGLLFLASFIAGMLIVSPRRAGWAIGVAFGLVVANCFAVFTIGRAGFLPLAVVFGAEIIGLGSYFWKHPARRLEIGAVVPLFFLISGTLCLPVLGGMALSASDDAVAIHRRETIGSYDTVILSGKDGSALAGWLDKNGYAMPAESMPMVAQLAREGWCFAVMKLHEAPDGLAHPHPMGFVFPASKAVYPMRLTGIGQASPLTVDLFVCGGQEAQAQGFHAGCAVETTRIGPASEPMAFRRAGWIKGAEPVPMVHPGLRRFASDAKVLTWLRGAVPAAGMDRDVEIGWKPLVPRRDTFYSADSNPKCNT